MTTWTDVLEAEKQQEYFKKTLDFVAQKRSEGINVFPPADEVFSAFKSTAFADVKVVILGQDPYHGPGQAHGLAFSVKPGVKAPPSLANMYKELEQDIPGFKIPQHGYLNAWAQQGVLLLNSVLTVEQGQAHSHKSLGWETFTDKVIAALNDHATDIVFILWGSHAQKKGHKIDTVKHTVLKGPHPSPLSAYRGFFGCKHFSKANDALIAHGKTPIDWAL